MRARAKVAVGALVLAALSSLSGGGALVLERLGMVTLRRVPRAVIFGEWQENGSATVAIVNTDTVGGSFRVARRHWWSDELLENPQRVWLPARSIVLRRVKDAEDVIELHQGRVPNLISSGDDCLSAAPSFVLPGERADLNLSHIDPSPGEGSPDGFYIPTRLDRSIELIGDGTHEIRSRERARLSDESEISIYAWDGTSPLWLKLRAVEPGQGIYKIWAGEVHGKSYTTNPTIAEVWVLEPDMRIIDERETGQSR